MTLNPGKLKAIDIASTYINILITLSSAIIAAIIGFYPTLLKIQDFNFEFLRISLVFFMFSIFSGLFALGGLVSATKEDSGTPTSSVGARIPTIIQLITFGLGILFLLLTLPMKPIPE